MAAIDDRAPVRAIFLSSTRMVIPSDIDTYEFVFGDDGRALRIVTVDADPAILERVE